VTHYNHYPAQFSLSGQSLVPYRAYGLLFGVRCVANGFAGRQYVVEKYEIPIRLTLIIWCCWRVSGEFLPLFHFQYRVQVDQLQVRWLILILLIINRGTEDLVCLIMFRRIWYLCSFHLCSYVCVYFICCLLG